MHQPITPVRLELKYCERCGSLWLRRADSGAIYCAPCVRAMAQSPGRASAPARADASALDDFEPPPRRGRPPLFLGRRILAQACVPEIVRLV